MDNEKIISFLRDKKNRIETLKSLSPDDKEFKAWYESLKALAERMGESYVYRVNGWTFWPMVVSFGDDDDSAEHREAYLNGLNEADASIESMIEELELWGEPHSKKTGKQAQSGKDVTLNLTISQQQAQHLTSEINLEQFDSAVQKKVSDLLEELQKKNKNKEHVKELVKWLADRSIDALIALLAAQKA
jgi:hypothetical protein